MERQKIDMACMRFPGFCGKTLTLSYDDGLIFDQRIVEIMQKNGLKGTFNLNGSVFNKTLKNGFPAGHLTEEECFQLFSASSNEIALHGYRHLPLAALSNEEIVYEVISDKATLENIFGRVIRGIAYPNGSYNDRVIENLKKCGVCYARTVDSTEKFDLPDDWLKMNPTCHHSNPRLMELGQKFIELNYEHEEDWMWFSETPKMFLLWGHSSEYERDNNWNILEEFAAQLGNRKDIWYATIGEIYEYTQAYKSLQFSADGTLVYNPSAIDVFIVRFGKRYIAHAGETLQL